MDEEASTYERILTSGEKQDMRGALFRQRECVGVDLSSADLRGARFVRTAIESYNLEGADLRGAHFIECDLMALLMAGAVLGANRFDGTVLSDIAGLSADARRSIERTGGEFQPRRASQR